MIELIIDKEVYNIPDKFSEINIDKYKKVYMLSTGVTYYNMEIISILGDIDIEVLKQVYIGDLGRIVDAISFLYKKPDYKQVENIEIKGRKFKLNDLKRILWSMFIDLETLSKNSDDINENLEKLMAILYHEEPYDADKILNNIDLFKYHMNMELVLGALFFFMNSRNLSDNHLKQFLVNRVMMEMET